MFDIHELTRDDFPAFVEIAHVMQEECEPDIPVHEHHMLANMFMYVNQPKRDLVNAWCVYSNKNLIGIGAAYISMYFYSTHKASTLLYWYVVPKHRDSRAAAGILRAFEKWSRANGAYRMHIGAERVASHEADKINAMVGKLGYHHHGEQFYKLAT